MTVWAPIVIEPDLVDVAVFSATVNVTEALPAPVDGEVNVIHEASSDAVHVQDESEAVSATLLLTPPAGASIVVGATEKEHAGGAAAA